MNEASDVRFCELANTIALTLPLQAIMRSGREWDYTSIGRIEGIMKISTRSRYAVRMLLDLAQHQNDGYVPLKDIAHRQEISKNYLDQIMMILNKSDFLETARGAQGGYRLAKDPKDYTLGDIVRLTEGGIAPLACLAEGKNECERYETCTAKDVWQGLGDVMSDYLDGVTLQDMLEREQPDGKAAMQADTL